MKKLLLGLSALIVGLFAPLSPAMRRSAVARSAGAAVSSAETEAVRLAIESVAAAEKALRDALSGTVALDEATLSDLKEVYKAACMAQFDLEEQESTLGQDPRTIKLMELNFSTKRIAFEDKLDAHIRREFRVASGSGSEFISRAATTVGTMAGIMARATKPVVRHALQRAVEVSAARLATGIVTMVDPDYESRRIAEMPLPDDIIKKIKFFSQYVQRQGSFTAKLEDSFKKAIKSFGTDVTAALKKADDAKTESDARKAEYLMIEAYEKFEVVLKANEKTLTPAGQDMYQRLKAAYGKFVYAKSTFVKGEIPKAAGVGLGIVYDLCARGGVPLDERYRAPMVAAGEAALEYGMDVFGQEWLADGVRDLVDSTYSTVGNVADSLMSGDGLPSWGSGAGDSFDAPRPSRRGASSRAAGFASAPSAAACVAVPSANLNAMWHKATRNSKKNIMCDFGGAGAIYAVPNTSPEARMVEAELREQSARITTDPRTGYLKWGFGSALESNLEKYRVS